jgi:hypothetical protein
MAMGVGRQRPDHSGDVSAIFVSVQKVFGGFKPLWKPGKAIFWIIFMVNPRGSISDRRLVRRSAGLRACPSAWGVPRGIPPKPRLKTTLNEGSSFPDIIDRFIYSEVPDHSRAAVRRSSV